MKKCLILLLCLSSLFGVAQTPIARVKQGESFTFTLNFPYNYDTSRIAKLTAFLGGAEVGDLGKSTIVPLNDSCFRLQLRSSRTSLLKGDYAFQIAVEDEIVGVKKTTPLLISFLPSNNTTSSSAVNTGSDVLVKVNILAPGIVANTELATIYKGDPGAPGPTGATGAQGPAGSAGAPGPAGSDASVTSGNIASALGYTPVSPAQLGTKQDTSASITTAKISDWTAAWAARFAAQSTSNLAEGTNLYHTTARVQAVGDARYLPLTGGILTNASTYQLRLAYDASNYLSATVNSTGTTTFQPTGTNAGININTTGTGVITTGATILPSVGNAYDLGNITNQFRILFSSIARVDSYRPYGNGNPIVFANTSNIQGARMFNSGNWIFGTGSTDNGNKVNVEGTANFTGNVGFGTASLTHAATFPVSSSGIALHNQADQTTNFEVGRLYWAGNILNLSTEKGGTGLVRDIKIATSSSSLQVRESYGTNSAFEFAAFNLSNFNSILRLRGTIFATNVASFFSNVGNVVQTGTAGYTANYTSIYEQALGTGPKILMDLGINSAANGGGTHDRRYAIENTGKVLQATGANRPLNTVTLSGGTVTVNNTLVTANSIISLTYQSCSNCGTAYISAKTAGTSFVITSTNASDASIIAYEIKN